MRRRKFIIGAGSATTAGLAGCIDIAESNGDPDQGSGDSDTELNSFNSNIKCAEGNTEEFSSIANPESTDDLYEFSGRMIIPNTCQVMDVDTQVEGGTLTVNVTSRTLDTECEDDCAGVATFAGNVLVSDPSQITDSQINTE